MVQWNRMQERFRATRGRGGEKRREAETNVRNTCRPNVNLSSFSSSFFFSVLKQINKRNEKRSHLSTFERTARDSTSHGGEPPSSSNLEETRRCFVICVLCPDEKTANEHTQNWIFSLNSWIILLY